MAPTLCTHGTTSSAAFPHSLGTRLLPLAHATLASWLVPLNLVAKARARVFCFYTAQEPERAVHVLLLGI
jgi:hypothetical protein